MNVTLRPIRPDDAAGLIALHARMSDHTRYLRFFTPCPRIPPTLLHRFVNVDHHSREAFVSLSGTRIVAVGRYERLSPSEAEVALVVEDAFQGQGVGRELLAHLALAARANGIERFVGTVLPENTGVMRWTRGYPVERRFADGLVSLGFPLGARGLQHEQLDALPGRGRRLGVRADFDGPAAVEHDGPVGVGDVGQPVGDQDRGPTALPAAEAWNGASSANGSSADDGSSMISSGASSRKPQAAVMRCHCPPTGPGRP